MQIGVSPLYVVSCLGIRLNFQLHPIEPPHIIHHDCSYSVSGFIRSNLSRIPPNPLITWVLIPQDGRKNTRYRNRNARKCRNNNNEYRYYCFQSNSNNCNANVVVAQADGVQTKRRFEKLTMPIILGTVLRKVEQFIALKKAARPFFYHSILSAFSCAAI